MAGSRDNLKEKNYGADWGDFVSFSRHMKQKAEHLGVDLLLVDTGKLSYGGPSSMLHRRDLQHAVICKHCKCISAARFQYCLLHFSTFVLF
jgi:ABC-type uncharacterized transport system ATPase subunit